jgi:hypothetical protein
MSTDHITQRVRQHLERFFEGHAMEYTTWPHGPILRVLPDLQIARIGPGPRTPLWSYVTVGAWKVGDTPGGLEFLVMATDNLPRHVELLAMVAHYHHTHRLGKWHTFPIGEPWVPGSSLEHVLVSLPYPLGPQFEICEIPEGHIHLLWLLPITSAESALKREHGVDVLQELFDGQAIEYWNPRRASVI